MKWKGLGLGLSRESKRNSWGHGEWRCLSVEEVVWDMLVALAEVANTDP